MDNNTNYSSYRYFSNLTVDPIFELFRVIDNSSHKAYKALLTDLEKLDNRTIEKYENDFKFYIDPHRENYILYKKYYTLIFEFRQLIEKERLSYLINGQEIVKPYDREPFIDVSIDASNLISTSFLKTEKNYFYKENYFVRISPTLGDDRSSHWVSNAIISIIETRNIVFFIRLDPMVVTLIKETYIPSYKLLVHGRNIDINRLISLRTKEFGQFENYIRNIRTQYCWEPSADELTLTVEEFPLSESEEINVSRYFHTIFNKKTMRIKHCDGAIRIYNKEELKRRKVSKLWSNETRKVGRRIKIFQFDDVKNKGIELELDEFQLLAKAFFVWNEDLINYFDLL